MTGTSSERPPQLLTDLTQLLYNTVDRHEHSMDVLVMMPIDPDDLHKCGRIFENS